MSIKTASALNEKKDELATSSANNLFPVFLKLEKLKVLIVGGGNVALEKVSAIIQNAPDCLVTIVAPEICEEIENLIGTGKNISKYKREVVHTDLDSADIAIIATGNAVLNREVKRWAEQKHILSNVADTPELCDFYLGSVVQKGHLKIGISTNGKSPTIAKRLKQVFNDAIPDEFDQLLENMSGIRSKLGGDFKTKVIKLNELTESLISGKPSKLSGEKKWRRIATISIVAFALMIAGYYLLGFIRFPELIGNTKQFLEESLTPTFFFIVLAGFLAQLADGLVSMGYGAINSSVMLSLGIPPAVISASVHTAEIFSTGLSGYNHYKFGNINKKLFRSLLIPGVIGAIAGAGILVYFNNHEVGLIRPILAAYCMILGIRILSTAIRKKQRKQKVKRLSWLAGMGGFLDSFGGGGWGPLVTSTLVSKGKTPRYVIGSVGLTEFFVTLASAFAFFIFLGVVHWEAIIALIIGSALAAPIAARLTGKLPLRTMLFCIGIMVILWSLRILVMSFT